LTTADEEVVEGKEYNIRPQSNQQKKFSVKPSKVVKVLEEVWDGSKANVQSLTEAKKYVDI